MFFRKNKKIDEPTKPPIMNEEKSQINQTSIKAGVENNISHISENLHITGTIYSSGKISFNGTVKGSLETKSVYIGKNGFIDGQVEADEAVILGRVKGTLKGNKVRLASSSRIEGDTFHQVIAIEDGAIYEGSIKRIKKS